MNNYYRVNNLTADTEYNFTVKAVNEAGKSTAFEAINVKTELAVDIERPSDIEEIFVEDTSKTSAEISWSEATDNIGVIGYKVYVNGILKDQVEGLNYTLEGLDKGVKYTVKIVAIDKAGNTSLIPASVRFVLEDEEVPPTEAVDKSSLQAVVESAKLLIKGDYTAESWANLEVALENANIVLANEYATEKEVAKAEENLKSAISELEIASNDTINSGTNNGSNNKDDGKTTSNSKLPKTGETNNVYTLIVGAILVVAGVLVMFTRKKKDDNTLK